MRHPAGAQRRRQRGRGGSPGGAAQGLDHPVAAGVLQGAHGKNTRRRVGHPPNLVRRHLPGPAQFFRADARCAGRIPRHAPGNCFGARREETLAGDPHRCNRRAEDGRAFQMEDRRPRAYSLNHLGQKGRQPVVGI